jgi:transcriptional regulator with XRE-family HTH domain
MSAGSIVIRRSLGRRLKALRASAGKTAADVAAASIASKAKLARIEGGQTPVKMVDVRGLCWLYGADQATTDLLADMAVNTASQGWWEDYDDVMPPWFGMYVELESAAERLLAFDSELVAGLLQTPAYHRAVYQADESYDPDAEGRVVSLRAGRQRAVFDQRRPPLAVTAVLGEGALRRRVGSDAVMEEQVARLRELDQQKNIDIMILPDAAGAHPAMKGAFNVLRFADDDDPDVVYVEALSGGRYMEQPETVARYRRVFDVLRSNSVHIEEFAR